MRRDRELAFYGTEDLTPSKFYSQKAAERALQDALWVVETIAPYVLAWLCHFYHKLLVAEAVRPAARRNRLTAFNATKHIAKKVKAIVAFELYHLRFFLAADAVQFIPLFSEARFDLALPVSGK